ncbi:hypothetical protein CCACVL1_02047, partial [Corchorus capsularis]
NDFAEKAKLGSEIAEPGSAGKRFVGIF